MSSSPVIPPPDSASVSIDAIPASLRSKCGLRPVSALRPYGRQARTHSGSQIALIEKSIRDFKFMSPVLIDEDNRVLAGNARVEAARRLGMESVPVLVHTHLNDADKRAYVLMDNATSDKAGIDRTILQMELNEISLVYPELDLTKTGYTEIEIDVVRFGRQTDDTAEDNAPLSPPRNPISRVGDLWILHGHRILCADATLMDSYMRLMGEERARLCFTDPPYNCGIQGFVTTKNHRSFPMAAGEMSHEAFVNFLASSLAGVMAHLVTGGLILECMDWRGGFALQTAAKSRGLAHLNTIVWDKVNSGRGGLYKSQHEFIFLFKHGDAPYLNNVKLGKHGRNRSNVWSYPGFSGFRSEGRSELEGHPTPKPVELVKDALLDCTAKGDLVLDPFSGGGTTLVAAERCGRSARVMELDPGYVDLAIRRWEAMTGGQAIHAETGLSLEALGATRARQEAGGLEASACPAVSGTLIPTRVRVRTRTA